METNNRIIKLIAKELTSFLTDEERTELVAWISGSEQNHRMYKRLTNKKHVSGKMRGIYAVKKKAGWKKFKAVYLPEQQFHNPVLWGKWPVTAISGALVIIIITYCFFQFASKNKSVPLVSIPNKNRASEKAPAAANVILPLGEKATLSLQNGFTVELNEVPVGVLTQVNNVQLNNKKYGELEVASTGPYLKNEHDVDTANSIRTPSNGQWMITLSDGTVVWLNASSTLTFPLHFNENERRVSLSGEAYFQVRQQSSLKRAKKIPFIVDVNGTQVFVTGTEFNVTAYSNEKPVTTLVTGKVQLINGKEKQFLQPGQQATVNEVGQFSLINNAPVAEAIAWKNKGIVLKDASIEKVMSKIKRLYDVEVIYEAAIAEHFTIDIDANTSLTNALENLSLTGVVKFSVNGRIITVTK